MAVERHGDDAVPRGGAVIRRFWRKLTGRHPYITVNGTSDEAKLASGVAEALERSVGRKFLHDVVITFRDAAGMKPSKSLHCNVGVVYEPRIKTWVVGYAEPNGRSCVVVRQTAWVQTQTLEHELAECLAIQHGLRGEAQGHAPREWSDQVWGWL